jgi:ATP-dependent Lhr-like helicase
MRFARTHAPFTADAPAARFGLAPASVEAELVRLADEGRLLMGAFRPAGPDREWCEAGVLSMLRARSLARLRKQIEPVDAAALARMLLKWQGIGLKRSGPDALLDVIEQLQGAPLVASALEANVLPARLRDYDPAWLDALMAAGEVVWRGLESIGQRDGRIMLALADHAALIAPPSVVPALTAAEKTLAAWLDKNGASFFSEVHAVDGGGYPGDTVDRLWDLVWKGVVSNDSMHALRAYIAPPARRRGDPRARAARPFRSRRSVPPKGEGRWVLTPAVAASARGSRGKVIETVWAAALGRQLLARYGIVTREAVKAENVPGGFATLYPVYKVMEEAGKVRRGYFIAGLGATQFAMAGAVDMLRSMRTMADAPAEVVMLAATDPANPYGAAVEWPSIETPDGKAVAGPARAAGALVWLVDGAFAAYLARGGRNLISHLPADEPARSRTGRALAESLKELAARPEGLLISEINGRLAADDPLMPFLIEAGLVSGSRGVHA